MRRRSLLELMLGGAAGLAAMPIVRALGGSNAARATSPDEFFVFIHAAGGWDVTLWSDPRNEKKGLIDPPSTDNTDTAGIGRWHNQTLAGKVQTFKPLVTPDGRVFGPGIGELFDLHDRLTVVNGLAMNTVSHPDGTCFSTTGRHLAGTRTPVPSIDTLLASAFCGDQLLPLVSMRFPSSYVGDDLDPRAVPLKVAGVGGLGKSLERSSAYLSAEDRRDVSLLLSDEAKDLARRSPAPQVYTRLAAQYDALPRMLSGDVATVFKAQALRAAYPELPFNRNDDNDGVLAAAFALEAMKRNVIRCVGLSLGALDTHNVSYRGHGRMLSDLFGVVAALVKRLDTIPHPTVAGAMLAEHTHIMVLSEFCRTPGINLGGGRDHYPNNSALVISPRFKPITYGKTDPGQLLPAVSGTFSDGARAIAPPDLLATYLAAFGIAPAGLIRDGEVVKDLLRA
jgi:hypothetical protein